MGVEYNEKQKKYNVVCDYCFTPIIDINYQVDGEISVYCVACNAKRLQGGIGIKGNGFFMPEQIEAIKEQKATVSRETKHAEKTAKITAAVNWTEVEAALTGDGYKVANAAKLLGVTPADLKEQLDAKYGDKIEYRRGRSGGARFTAKFLEQLTTLAKQ